MSIEDYGQKSPEEAGSVTTFYDTQGNCLGGYGPAAGSAFDGDDKPMDRAELDRRLAMRLRPGEMDSADSMTSAYDANNRLTSIAYGEGFLKALGLPYTIELTLPVSNSAEEQESESVDGSIMRLFVHTFEFRLSGSESSEQSLELPAVPVGDMVTAATTCVRASVARRAPAGAVRIGGVEVSTEVRGDRVFCMARLSDFAGDDLIVVQADVSIYWVRIASLD